MEGQFETTELIHEYFSNIIALDRFWISDIILSVLGMNKWKKNSPEGVK